VAPPAPGAPVTLNQPGDPQAAAQLAKLTDPDSSKTAAEFRANGDDIYGLNRFERPFSAGDMKIYYPDIDIVSARLAVDDRWIYVNINMSGLRGDSLSGYYAFEVDLNRDGRGDYLISALAPGTEWSTSGVAIWQDKNRDVGGEQVYYSDPPQKGDGYETVIFDQGSGDVPDLAWSRISPTDPKMVQVAFKSSLFDSDTPFAWWVWASRDLYKPGWFNYHDHFTQEEAGSPLKDQVRFYPLKALAAIDNSCRVAVGFPVTGQTVYCQTP